MKEVTIQIGEDDIQVLEEIFKNESNFEPVVKQDRVIVAVLKEVLNKSKSA
ncbi:MAG: hypothetical protein RI886_896 [Pseudomonadota bacterium]